MGEAAHHTKVCHSNRYGSRYLREAVMLWQEVVDHPGLCRDVYRLGDPTENVVLWRGLACYPHRPDEYQLSDQKENVVLWQGRSPLPEVLFSID